MARTAGGGRRKFFHSERRGGNFVRARVEPVFGEWRGISYRALPRSSGAGELYEQGKCCGFLRFLREGLFAERPPAVELDAQRRPLSCAKRTRAAASRPAAGYPEFGDERARSEEHTSELQSLTNLVCRLLLEKKKTK